MAEAIGKVRRLHQWFWPPQPKPLLFHLQSDEIVERLSTPDPEKAKLLYEEAQDIYDEATSRAESAERRATVLQGSVAIAVSVTLAGGAVLLDPSKLKGHIWRVLFVLALSSIAVCLAGSGYRALLATSRRFKWATPAPEEILDRGSVTTSEIRILRAADLLTSYGINDQIAAAKVALMAQAVRWFIAALVFLIVFIGIAVAYSIWGPSTDTAFTQDCADRAMATHRDGCYWFHHFDQSRR